MAILCWTTAILGPKTASLPLSQSHTITYIAIATHITFLFHICSVRSIIQTNIFTLRTIVQQDPKTMYSLPFRICCSHIFAVATYLLPIICCCHIIFLLPLMCWCHIVCCYPGFVVAAHRNVHKFSFLSLSLHWKVQSVKLFIKAILLNFPKWLNLHLFTLVLICMFLPASNCCQFQSNTAFQPSWLCEFACIYSTFVFWLWTPTSQQSVFVSSNK